jgi:hypothetical protein
MCARPRLAKREMISPLFEGIVKALFPPKNSNEC